MMPMGKALTRSALAWVLALGLGSARAGSPLADSGSWVQTGSERTIYWIDNSRLVYIGDERVQPGKQAGEPSLALLSWEPGKAPQVYRKYSDMVCYRPGQILYAARDRPATSRVFYQGLPGLEKAVRWSRVDRLNCDATYQAPSRSENRAIVPLRREHGYLHLGALTGAESMENTLVRLKAPDGQVTELPFGRREMITPEFHQFKGAYFVPLAYFDPVQNLSTASWPRGKAKHAFWLWPDGRTERIAIAHDIDEIHPTRAGNAFRVTGRRGRDGLYIEQPGERKRVARGHVTQLAVSPDGCKLAFAHAPDARKDRWGARNERTLKVADVCEEG
jgi:hypothetical protein